MEKSILVVDNSLVIRKVITKLLRQGPLSDACIHEAENGADALALLADVQVDFVFLDLNMPVMDGFQFLEELKKYPQLASTEVIVCSTEGGPGILEKLKAVGVERNVLKPIKPDAFNAMVEDLVKE